ncbi:AP-1-like transcription factor [Clarireedia jacksonii]
MDYPYFTAPQNYFAMGLPPTPDHGTGSISDEFNNSPPEIYDQFQPFGDRSNQYNTHRIPKPITPLSNHNSLSTHHNYKIPLDDAEDANRRGSNSDDEDMTPAQSRRKAQNRAAQRAFRERKERHVKDLEAKLAALEKNTGSLAEENERLKLQLTKTATENEILKATSGQSHHGVPDPTPSVGPMSYSPTDFYSQLLQPHTNKTPSHRIVTSEAGERLLAAGAAWDFIITHPLYQRGMVDVGDVSERLKDLAKCDGQGPVFEERAILDAIEKSVASGNDELL